MGKSHVEMAAMVGLAPGTVGEIVSTPEYKERREKYADKIFGGVDQLIETRKAQTILDDAAPNAADALIELLESEDDVTKRITATAILDRTGHSPIQRKAVKHRIELDPALAGLLKEALEESAEARAGVIDVEVEE